MKKDLIYCRLCSKEIDESDVYFLVALGPEGRLQEVCAECHEGIKRVNKTIEKE
jgi:hypothetical protein